MISVLFADLVGFTAHTESSDPEDVRARLTMYHRRLREDVERFGGRIEKLLGDGVFAVFGAPTAHEDDPERAVRAALRAQESVEELNKQIPELALSVRVAVTTGEAIVQLDDSDVDREGIVGDVVNTASRLQGEADPGTVVVDERTYAATRAIIEYLPLESVSVKGKVAPLAIWRATGARARLGVALEDKMTTSFIGRSHELSMLVDAFDRTVAEKRSQVVTISGEPGVGKSRLVAEFRKVLDDRPNLVVWRQGRCLPYGESITFHALAEIVKSQAGILATETPDVAKAKLRLTVENSVANEEEHDWIFRSLEVLVAIDDTVEADPAEAAAGWRQFLAALANQSPLVIVIEDLHWADDALVTFLNELPAWGFDLPIFLICTSRPEIYSEHPEWGVSTRNAINIGLAPLGENEIAGLLDELLETGTMSPTQHSELVERCGGNPLYAIEYAGLVREGGGDLTPPDSVQALIAARLDLLDTETRTFLQAAAVVGRVFWSRALMFLTSSDAAVTDAAIRNLQGRELVWPVRSRSMEGQDEFLFRHVLVRDVAYGQIPRTDRARLHEQVGRWLEALSAGNLGETAALLAHHYSVAFELRSQLGEDRPDLADQARRFTLVAADQARNLDAAAAMTLYSKAAELSRDPGERGRLLLVLSEIENNVGELEAATAHAAEAVGLFAEQGEAALQADAMVVQARSAWLRGDGDEHDRLTDTAYDLVRGLEPSRPVARVLRASANRLFLRGRSREAHEAALGALEMTRAFGTPSELVTALRVVGSSLALQDQDRSRELQLEAMQLAMDNGLTQEELYCRNTLHAVLLLVDGPLQTLDIIEPAIKLSQQRGFEAATEFSRSTRVENLLPLGRWEEARSEVTEIVAWDETRGGTAITVMARHMEIVIDLYQGRTERAAELVAETLGAARGNKDLQVVVPAVATALAVGAETGDRDGAQSLATELVALAEGEADFHASNLGIYADAMVELGRVDDLERIVGEMDIDHPLVRTMRTLGRGRVALARAQHEEAAEQIATAREALGRIDFLLQENQCRVWEAEARVALGEAAAARDLISAAREFFEPIGAQYFLERLKTIEAKL